MAGNSFLNAHLLVHIWSSSSECLLGRVHLFCFPSCYLTREDFWKQTVWSRTISALARVKTNTNWKQELILPVENERRNFSLSSPFSSRISFSVFLKCMLNFTEVSPLRNVFSGTWEPPFWSAHIKGDRAPLSRFPWEHKSLTSWAPGFDLQNYLLS